MSDFTVYPVCGGCGRPFNQHKTSEMDACRAMADRAGRPYAVVALKCPSCGGPEAEPTGGTLVVRCLKCNHLWNPEKLP